MLSRVDEPNFITTTKQENSTSTTTTSRSRSKDPRIVRVSRALGGKDRHSKVCTVRGLRDRRVRLSVPTAIQLYDLQDRLGLNQPSKVVDWLLNVAKHDIDELPPLQFPPGSLVNPNFHPMVSNFQEFASSHQSAKQGLIMSKDHASCQTSSPIEDVTRFNLQNQGELNNFNSIPGYNSFVRSSSSWDHDPSSLTLNHDYQPSISLGLRAHHQNFGFLQSGPPGLQSSNQVLVYHQQLGMNTTQPYFTQTNMGFEPKGSTNYQTPSDISNHVIRPFQFRMAANLLPSQCNALNEENKRD